MVLKRATAILFVLLLVTVSLWAVGFIAIETTANGTGFYVGPLYLSVDVTSWFPGRYL